MHLASLRRGLAGDPHRRGVHLTQSPRVRTLESIHGGETVSTGVNFEEGRVPRVGDTS